MKGPLILPLLRSQPQATHSRAYEESGMSVRWLSTMIWAFGPAQAIVQQHFASFQEWPPVSTAALANQEKIKGMLENGGMGQ